MIDKIIEFSIKNRGFVFLITLITIAIGIKSFQELPIDAVPDITNTQVQINTAVKGLVPEEIERMITFPLENAVNAIAGVQTVRSLSRYGISQVTVIFEDGFDIFKARQLISEKIQTVELPDGMRPEMGPISTGLGEIYHYAIEAKVPAKDPQKRLLQLMELRSLQEWYIKPRLLTVKGVTEVNTIGGYEKQFFIEPDIKKMAQHGIHFDDIERAIKKSNLNVGGGYIDQTAEQILVRAVGLLQSIDNIKQVVVKQLPTSEVVRIGDIAQVKFDKDIRTGAATVAGEESIVGTVFMLLGANSRTVSIDVNDKLADIKKTLPAWVKLETLYNRSNMVNATLSTVEHNLILGAALVMVILLVLVGNIRAALITSIVIPISLLITFILMRWQNVSGNLMSLGALDFGIIVDGAVIVVENAVHRLALASKQLGRKLTREEIRDVVHKATVEIRSAAGFGEIIIIVVFIPLFALAGVEGKMFGPMAATFIMALISALVLSFTLVPALAATFLSGNPDDSTPWVMRQAEKLFTPILKQALRFKFIVLAIGVMAIVSGITLFTKLGSEFMPQLDEGDFAFQMIRPSNVNLETSILQQEMSEKIIESFPQVKRVFGRTGAAEIAADPMGVNITDCYVMLKDRAQWPKNSMIKTKQDLIDKIKEKLELMVPGQSLMVTQPVELKFNELLEGAKAAVAVKIFGPDMDKLISYAKQVSGIVSKIEGVGEVESETKTKAPLLQYTPKLELLGQLGVTAWPVLDTIQTAIGGKQVGYIYKGVKRFPIVIRLDDSLRKDISTIQNLPVGIGEGHTVPINQVATIEYTDTYPVIARENSQRRVAVLINPKTRNVQKLVEDASTSVAKKVKLPEGYFIEWGGSFKNLISAKQRLMVLVPMALLLIIFMLYAAFKSFAQVLLIFACAPMSLIGGVLALNIMQMPFSISAGVGFIALSGISILNGVVLVTYFNRLYSQGLTADEIVTKGTMTRLRPVLMTALADVFGFLPMMFSTGLGAGVQKPLATVVVGGMLSTTLLTLIVIPALYRLFFKYMK